jgi:hypothetical protein
MVNPSFLEHDYLLWFGYILLISGSDEDIQLLEYDVIYIVI